MHQKQVSKEHYRFNKYMHKRRWSSIWHQLDEISKLNPSSVLEIGPGAGVFKALCTTFGISVKTLDIDKELEPDFIASADSLPFEDNSFEAVCAFQMLEHVPFESSLQIFSEMCRVSSKSIVISLPDAKRYWPYSIYIPKVGDYKFLVKKLFWKKTIHEYDGQHYWEVNTEGYDEKYIENSFLEAGKISLKYTYRVKENPYHRFYVFEKL